MTKNSLKLIEDSLERSRLQGYKPTVIRMTETFYENLRRYFKSMVPDSVSSYTIELTQVCGLKIKMVDDLENGLDFSKNGR